MLTKRREKVGIENLKNPKAFIDYSQTTDNVYENLEDYNPTKKRKVLIVFDDMISDMESNKKLTPVVNKLFLRARKLNISLVFVSQSYFKVPFLFLKISYFKDFMKLYKDFAKEPYSFLVNDATLSSDNPLRFRKNLL